ncbi:MAG: hypothetical protein ACQXXE_01255 [Candidatus Bathyarchaeia archaeon]
MKGEKLKLVYGVIWVLRESGVCLCLMVVGAILFLYGSNYYQAIVGWTGVVLVVVGFFAFVTLKLHRKQKNVETK